MLPFAQLAIKRLMRHCSYQAARRWTRATVITRPPHLTAFARASSSLSFPPLRELSASPAAQQWLQVLATAPCLVCSGGKKAPPHRAAAAVSAFPLTCSPECDHVAIAERANELRVFQQIHEDLAYTAGKEAKTLLTHVLTRERRTQQMRDADLGCTRVASWEAFTRQFTDDTCWLQDPRAVRLASAAYTFVATLSHFLPVLHGNSEHMPPHMDVHVVGARTESMMPRHIWEELADAYAHMTFDLKLIGDHVVRYPRKKNDLVDHTRSSIRLQNYPGLYHQVVASTEALRPPPDAFVLFNPGIGHPKLRSSWRPTMEIILRSGKPALLTSFSLTDQDRDVDALHDMVDEFDLDFLVSPRENAFSSRCFQLDPTDVFAPIRTNSHVLVVRGQAK